MKWRWFFWVFINSHLCGCGGASTESAAKTIPAPAPCPVAVPGEKEKEIRAMLMDVLEPMLCAQLRGALIGLPSDNGGAVVTPGGAPSAGRWWIRRCSASFKNEQLELAIGGIGFSFIDQEASGFRVRQYLFFDASADMRASFDVGYDHTTRVASLWFRPEPNVTAQVRPLNAVTASATGAVSSLAGGILSVFGQSVDDKARAQVESEGSKRLKEQLGQGFTLTLDLSQDQIDFSLGALSAGKVPEHPFAPDNAMRWQVNQRSRVWPGGFDLIGPILPQQGTTTVLDIALEEGEGAMVGIFCASELEPFADSVNQHKPITLPKGALITELRQTNMSRTVTLPEQNCPQIIALLPLPAAQLPLQARYRIASPVSPKKQAPAPIQNEEAKTRIQLGSIALRTTNLQGHSWDIVGGGPDVFVTVSSAPASRVLFKSPIIDNQHDAAFNMWLGEAVPLSLFPLRFVVMDEDTTSDELIGISELDRATAERGGAISLPIRATDSAATQMGTLRIVVERQPSP